MASYYDTSDTDLSDAWNTDLSLSDEFILTVHKAFTTDTWKRLLDFARTCTGPEQRCWLCTELTPWNRAMHRLGFELVELRPGKLCLRSGSHRYGDMDWDRSTDVGRASSLVSLLLQYHPCIDELKVDYSVYVGFRINSPPLPISLRPAAGNDCRRTLRSLELQQTASACFETIAGVSRDCFELLDLDAIGGLERLKLTYAAYVDPKFAAELAKLLRRNASSIKRFAIKDVMVPRQINHALRYLFSCESLTVSSSGYGRGCLRSVSSVARLLHSSTELKELSIGPIASPRQIDAIAKELENNTSLAKLDVQIGAQRCSLEPLFTALQRNTTLRELRVTGCRIDGECGQSLALLVGTNTGLRLLSIEDAEVSERCLIRLAAALKVNTTLETLHLLSGMLPRNGIAELCKVLCINKTLKELRFTDFECPQEFRCANLAV